MRGVQFGLVGAVLALTASASAQGAPEWQLRDFHSTVSVAGDGLAVILELRDDRDTRTMSQRLNTADFQGKLLRNEHFPSGGGSPPSDATQHELYTHIHNGPSSERLWRPPGIPVSRRISETTTDFGVGLSALR